MNNVTKFKVLIVALVFFIFLAITNNIYAYDMKFQGYMNKNESGDYAIVRSIGQTYGGPKGGYKYDNKYDWFYIDRYNTPTASLGGYITYAIWFHTEPLTNYTDSGSANESMGYDYNDNWINVDELEADKSSESADIFKHKKLKYVNSKKNKENNILKIDINAKGLESAKVLEYRITYGNIKNTQNTYTVSDWKLSSEVIKAIIEKDSELNGDLLKTIDGKKNVTYYSLPAKACGNNYTWDTSYSAITTIHKGVMDEGNIGVYRQTGSSESAIVGQSIVNLYDNLVQFPKINNNQEIYIRHVDEKGNLIDIANSAEVLINSKNKESIKSNGEDTNEHPKYQEYYKIDLNQKLRVSRSLIMASNGKKYTYKKALVSKAETFKKAKELDNKKTNNNVKNKVSFSVSGTEKKPVTIVTFIYSEDKVPGYPIPNYPSDEDSPTGDIHTDLYSDNDKSNCIQKYTPTGEYITPYLKANKVLLKDLVYKLQKDNNDDNKIVYKIKTFNVQKLVGGKIDDNLINYPETGKIFGDEYYTLLEKDANRTLTIKDFDLTEAKNFKESYNKGSLPSQSAVDTFVENQSKSGYEDFNENKRLIPEDKYNGVRNPKLSAKYKAVSVLSGEGVGGSAGYIATNNKVNIIVYNPLDLKDLEVKSKEIIDHTTSLSTNTNVIQKNADFTVSFGTKSSSHYAKISDTSKYLDYYYLIFDIDVILKSNYQVKERTDTGFTALKNVTAGYTATAGTLIRINKGDKEFNAIASSNEQGKDIVSQVQNNVVLIGVTNNKPSANMPSKDDLEGLIFDNAVKKYVVKNETIEEKYINTTTSTNLITFKDYCDDNSKEVTNHESKYTSNHQMYSDAYYFAMAKTTTTNVGRIYDFKVTDCSDIDYKKVFRKSDTLNSVNDLTGVQYFSGVKLFNIYTNEINTLKDRTELNIANNSAAKKIIPLGPYKNTNTSYVSAPKMGYRVSFDLKTSGFYDQNTKFTREILIKPSYYYISKDGKTFKDNINLYYKNSSGKYVNFVGSDYTIYFKPKDGYRSIANSVTAGNTTLMSEQLEPLKVGSSSGFTLNSKMMSIADNKFIQAWYGEFKLPNSTIAVEGSNISKPLTNGYIGVKFEIKSIDKDASEKVIREISYNQNNQNAENKTNTTQWDYEGFLGFTNYGNEVDKITLQLEKGNWEIDNSTYQRIKGTVVLFDTDNRAANDFD